MAKAATFFKKYWIHILVVLVVLVGAGWLMRDDWEMYTARYDPIYSTNNTTTSQSYKDIYYNALLNYKNAEKNYNKAKSAYNAALRSKQVYIGDKVPGNFNSAAVPPTAITRSSSSKIYRHPNDTSSTNYTASTSGDTAGTYIYPPGTNVIADGYYITGAGCPPNISGCQSHFKEAEKQLDATKALLQDAMVNYKPRRKLSTKQKIRRFFGMKY